MEINGALDAFFSNSLRSTDHFFHADILSCNIFVRLYVGKVVKYS